MPDNNLEQCYNRGCGQKFDPAANKDDSCQHHPGEPFFHDAYKGWTCCNKKCTDFTEFLNIKGCQFSKHSNIKPPEPEKPVVKDLPEEVIEVKPVVQPTLERPPYETPLTLMVPEVAPSLKQQKSVQLIQTEAPSNPTEVTVGTNCKNGGCSVSYEGPQSNESTCVYHPGVPIFHEGLKFWSCCQKRTTDFNAFLNQIGCETGKHVWIKNEDNSKDVQCRWDYHQTGSHVVVSIYAKEYCPDLSTVQLNPVRLVAKLVFPKQNNAAFNLDIELRGIVNVAASQVSMFGTKVEIKLKKAEPGSWAKLEIPRVSNSGDQKKTVQENIENITPQVEAVDLSDL